MDIYRRHELIVSFIGRYVLNITTHQFLYEPGLMFSNIDLLLNYPWLCNSYESTYKNTALHLAVLYRDYGLVNILVYRGAKLYAKNIYGKTPIDFSTEHEGYELIKLYLIIKIQRLWRNIRIKKIEKKLLNMEID